MRPQERSPRVTERLEVNGTEWTKRDELAAMFMQGMLSEYSQLGPDFGGAKSTALKAYLYADGFLAAREELERGVEEKK